MDNIIIAKELLHLAKEIVGIINPNDMLKWKQQAEQLDNREWENRDYSLKEISEMNKNQTSDEEKEEIEKQNQKAAENAKHNDLMDRVFDAYVNHTEFPDEVKDKDALRAFLSGSSQLNYDSKSFSFNGNIELEEYMVHNGGLLFRFGSIGSMISCEKNIGMTSLVGLPEKFNLCLSNNLISSLEELKDKKIGWICIKNSNITNLKGLPSGMKEVLVSFNKNLKSLEGIENCIDSITKLFIVECPITNLKGLPSGMKEVNVSFNKNLKSLEGIENCIDSITKLFIIDCPSLTEVTLPSGNKIPEGLPAKHLNHKINVICDNKFRNGFEELGYI